MNVEFYDTVPYTHKVLERLFRRDEARKVTSIEDLGCVTYKSIYLANTSAISSFRAVDPAILLCNEFSLQRAIDYVRSRLGESAWVYDAVDAMFPVAIERAAGDRTLAERHIAWVLVSCPSQYLYYPREKFIMHFNGLKTENWRANVVRAVPGLWQHNIIPLMIEPDGAVQVLPVEPRQRAAVELFSQHVMSGRAEGLYEMLMPLLYDTALRRNYEVCLRDTVDVSVSAVRYILETLRDYNIPVYRYNAPYWSVHKAPALYIPYNFIKTAPLSSVVWLVPRYDLHTQWPSFVLVYPNPHDYNAIVGVLSPGSTLYLAALRTLVDASSFIPLYSDWCGLMQGCQPTWRR